MSEPEHTFSEEYAIVEHVLAGIPPGKTRQVELAVFSEDDWQRAEKYAACLESMGFAKVEVLTRWLTE